MTDEGWEAKHSPYTPEGKVESARRFARAASRRPRGPELRRFVVAIVVALVAVVLIVIVGALLTR